MNQSYPLGAQVRTQSPLGNVPERRLVIGGIVFPFTESDTGANLGPIADPFQAAALPYWKHALNHYLSASYVAAMAGQALPATSQACVETCVINPAPFFEARALRMPLLACYPVSGVYGEQSLSACKVETVYQLAYILPALDWAKANRVGPILQAALHLLCLATEEGGLPSYQGGARVWEGANTMSVRFGAFQIGPAPAIETAMSHYALTADVTVALKEEFDVGTGVELWGHNLSVGIADDGQGGLEGLVEVQTE